MIVNENILYFLGCSAQCSSCRFEAGDCKTCAGTNRVLSNPINLVSGVLNANGFQYSSTCICAPGYYDDGTDANCQPCASKCAECVYTSTNCSVCAGRYRVIPACTACISSSYVISDANNPASDCTAANGMYVS